ncbi:MAG: YgfZ/GcvT domain-containing protein [Actinomycetota bacterium]
MLPLDEAYDTALHEGVWLERPPALRLVRLTGEQRIWFLQNTITADVEDVPPGRWVESCFLDPKGRVQAHFRVGIRPDEVWLDVAPDAERLAHWFETYRFRTKVEIETVPKRSFTVLGPAARDLAADGEFAGELVFGSTLGDVPAADVHADATPAGEQAPSELYDVVRVEAGVGGFGVDFGERDLPQEAGLTRTVSVEKGCYVGQETVARIHFRGHINKVVRPLLFSAEPPVGAELRLEGSNVGRVTSVVRSPRKGIVGLGMVRVEPSEGSELEVEGGGTATVGAVPEGTKVKTG